jgi:tetratricopeptide (TPR) repeat protein
MSDLAYIDSYFKGELSADERIKFEQRIADDAAFAGEVAFYCSAVSTVKDQLVEEKKKQFRELYYNDKNKNKKARPSLVKKLWPYIAAAAVITGIIVTLTIVTGPSSPQQMADKYIKEHFEVQMGVTMTDNADSLDAAMQLYNENKLPEALRKFEKIIQTDSITYFPKKMAGIVSLRIGEYDKAIEYFIQLENLQLYSNPGKLYHALTLIKRNRAGDKEMATQLLKQVIDLKLEGKETARKWLKSL